MHSKPSERDDVHVSQKLPPPLRVGFWDNQALEQYCDHHIHPGHHLCLRPPPQLSDRSAGPTTPWSQHDHSHRRLQVRLHHKGSRSR